MRKIGIVILNYKTYMDTERLVNDILAFEDDNKYTIVIVDNASPNESYYHLCNFFDSIDNVHVIQSGENGGYAKGNNLGAKFLEQYSPDYILVLNNDIYFKSDIIEKCISTYEMIPDVGALAPIQLLPNGKNAPITSLKCNTFLQDLLSYSIVYGKFRKKHKYYNNCEYAGVQCVHIIPGCFVFMSFKRFKEIGFFYEETFLFCEERFLYIRFKSKGYKNYIILNNTYIHDHSHTINSEVIKTRQLKFLNEGYCIFTRHYRKFSALKILILKVALVLYIINCKLLSKIRRK